MKHLISQYPVTRDYIEKIKGIIGDDLEPVVVSTITAAGYLGVLKYFWRLSSEGIFLPVIESSGRPLLAPLQILVQLSNTSRYSIIEPDLSLRNLGLFDALSSGVRFALGTLFGAMASFFAWYRLGLLLKARRVPLINEALDRVLYLKTSLWLGIQAGGSVAHTAGVVGGLLENGLNVDFASVEAPVNLPLNDALKIKTITPQKAYIIPREFNTYRHNQPFIKETLPLLREGGGVIYQRLSLGNYAGVALSRRFGLPLVMEYNGSESWLSKNWGTPLTFEKLAMRAEEVCLRHAHMVVTVSDVLRDELISRGVEADRIVSCPNGADTNAFNPERYSIKDIAELKARYGISKETQVVTFVGTFGPWHGAEIFARALRDIADNDPRWLEANKLNFMFIGDGVRRPVVEALTKDPKIKPYATITGLIDQHETPLHLAASDILVSPHVPNPDGSAFFGSPTKLFEYLASGRPVIASDLGQIGEVLDGCPSIEEALSGGEQTPDGACGILIEPENVSELALAIKFMVENPGWRKKAGKNSRKRALARYTWNHHVKEILDGLERVRVLDLDHNKAPVRVLFNGLHSKSGGGLTYVKNVVPIMARDPEIDLHLCLHKDQKDLLGGSLDRGVTFHYLDFPPGFWRLQVSEQIQVPKLAKKIRADVTFSPANYGPLAAPNSVILLRNALSVAFVERRPMKLAYWALVYMGTLLSMLMAKQAITVSNYARTAASGGLIGLFGDRLTVIPHGVSPIFSPSPKGGKRDKFLLAVSDIYVQKNLKNLLLALSRLRADHPDILLKIAGRPIDTDYFEELKNTISKENLDRNVEFLGEVAPHDLVGYYRRCGVFVFPSTVETFGNPLVEAMACGAPIACSNRAAMPEVAGNAAIFFDPLDIVSMTDAIRCHLNDSKLRQALGKLAIEKSKNYSWEITSARTLKVLKRVPFLGD